MRLVCVVGLILLCWWPVQSLNATAHQQMLSRLQYPGYDKSIRPNTDGEPVEVRVDVVLNSLGPVNEMDMTWTASFYLRQEWTDRRLVLRGSDSIIRLDGDQVNAIWLPDTFFSNEKDGHKHDLTVPNHLVYINSSTGRLLYSQRLTLVLKCEMDLIKFPHDNQSCSLDMESYSYTTRDLLFKWSSERTATSLLATVYMPDFAVDGITTHDCSSTYAIGTYPCLRATVLIHREIGFYVIQSYLPSILIVILSWASFWIDHEAVPARISVGLLTVLTITTQLSGARAQLPRVPYVKAIDVWMSTNLVFVFTAYMEYALVTVLSRKYKKTMARRAAAATSVSAAAASQSFSDLANTEAHLQPTGNGQDSGKRRSAASGAVLTDKAGHDTGTMVDKGSRLVFPLGYTVFNLVYWFYYLLHDQ